MNTNEPNREPVDTSQSIRDRMRLELFLREASAIITSERGLNASSRLKLESLANHQKLPDRLFDEAIRQLQEQEYQPPRRRRYEREFAKYLAGEFAKLKGGVISTAMEQNANELARTKYQIAPFRVEEIIAEQAELASVSRVSRTEAESYAIRYISERVSDRKEIDDEFRNELYQTGRRMGLSQDRVDDEIIRLLNLNRTSANNRVVYWRIVGIGVGIGTLIIAAMAAVYWVSRPLLKEKDSPIITDLVKAPVPGTKVSIPEWLPREVFEQLEQVADRHPALVPVASEVVADSAERRRDGYAQLVQFAVTNPDRTRAAIEDLISQFYYREPDPDVAAQVLNFAVKPLKLENSLEQVSTATLEDQRRANRLMAEIFYFRTQIDPRVSLRKRKSMAAECMQSLTGIDPHGISMQEYLQRSEQVLAVDQWTFLINHYWSSPGKAAMLVEPLTELTRSKMPANSLHAYRSRLLMAILQIDERQWSSLQNPIRETISNSDPVELMEWIGLYFTLDSSEDASPFSQFLGEQIAVAAGLSTNSRSISDIRSALERFRTEQANRSLRHLLSANDQIDQHTQALLDGLSVENRDVSPDLIARLAFAIQLNLRLIERIDQGRYLESEDLEQINAMVQRPRIRLRDLISLAENSTPEPVTTQPGPFEINRKQAALEKLEGSTEEMTTRRMLGLEQLERLAPRFDDLPYREARFLAGYLLGDWPEPERLNIQRRIGAFSAWTSLKLALADAIGEPETNYDAAVTLARRLFQYDFDVAETDDWQSELQRRMLQRVQQQTAEQLVEDNANDQSDWERLQIYLAQLYVETGDPFRSGESPYGESVDQQPSAAMLSMIKNLLEQWRLVPTEVMKLNQLMNMLNRADHDEMDRLIAANQLLFRLILNVEAMQDQDVRDQILNQAQERFASSKTAADQLFTIQVGLLEAVSQLRANRVLSLVEFR